MNLNNYRSAGVIYKISDTEMVGKKKDFPKRMLFLEVPTTNSMDKKTTEILKFTVVGPECGSLDYYEENTWVSVVFRIAGRFWRPPDDPEKEVHFMNLEVVDISREPNPFEHNQEPESPSADELSPDIFNEFEKKKAEPIGPQIDDEDTGLPF